jgi:hypothetical protein
VVVKRNRSGRGSVRSNIITTDDGMMSVRRGNIEMESSLQYISMAPGNDLCFEDGDYASVSSNPRYSVGLGLGEGKKRFLVAQDSSQPQCCEDFKHEEAPRATDTSDHEEQDQSTPNEEGIYEEPSNLVDYLQIVEEESKAAVHDHET